MKLFKIILFAMCFFMVTFQAHAGGVVVQSQEQAQAQLEEIYWGTSTYKAEAGQNLTALNDGINKFTVNFQAKLQPIGMKLFALLAIIALSWGGIKVAMASGSGSLSEPMTLTIRTVFLMGFVYYLLSPEGYNLMVVNFLGGLTDQVVILAMPDGTTAQNGFLDFSNAQLSILTKAWDQIRGAGFWEFVTNLGGMVIFTILLQILYAIFVLLAFVGYLSALVSVAIAFAIGPLFIPFLMVEKTSFLFDGWVKFTISACLSKVVIYILVAIGLYAFDALAGSNGSVLGTLFLAAALGGMLAFHMLRAPEIAQSLTSGGAVSFGRLVGQGLRKLTSK